MGFYRFIKRSIDICTSALGLVVCAPIMAIVALAIWRVMGRPVLFEQVRPGLGEAPFRLYKFRTMSEARDAQDRLLPDAERLGRLGRFLRKTSLDELPQLWNVLRGDMSLVGPRPLFTSYLPHYTPREKRRHEVRPGITGLAQVSGRNHLLWDERLELDVKYVENLSFWLDLRILLKTVAKVLLRQDVIVAPGTVQGPLTEYRTPAHQSTMSEDA